MTPHDLLARIVAAWDEPLSADDHSGIVMDALIAEARDVLAQGADQPDAEARIAALGAHLHVATIAPSGALICACPKGGIPGRRCWYCETRDLLTAPACDGQCARDECICPVEVDDGCGCGCHRPEPAHHCDVCEAEHPPADGMCPGCQGDPGANWFDRSICPEPCGRMHTRCVACDHPLDGCVLMPVEP